jgi:hypothetical protein
VCLPSVVEGVEEEVLCEECRWTPLGLNREGVYPSESEGRRMRDRWDEGTKGEPLRPERKRVVAQAPYDASRAEVHYETACRERVWDTIRDDEGAFRFDDAGSW